MKSVDSSKVRPLSATKIFRKKEKTKNKYPIISVNNPRNSDNPYRTYINKVEGEDIYKENIELKEKINELNSTIDFLKSNNQKLNLIISKKNKEIDKLTSENLSLNKQIINGKKREKKKIDINKNTKQDSFKKQKNEEIKDNSLKDDYDSKKIENKIKEQSKEIEYIKKTYNSQLLLIQEKDKEINNLKKNSKITKENEEKIQNEILLEEMEKLKALFSHQKKLLTPCLFTNEEISILKDEIKNQHEIILKLVKENSNLKREKRDTDDKNEKLFQKLENSNNMRKFEGKKLNKLEDNFKSSLRKEAISVFEKQEKEELIAKIKKLSASLEYYRMQCMKSKNFGSENKNQIKTRFNGKNKMPIQNSSSNVYNNINNITNIFQQRQPIAIEKANPEEKYNEKVLLMQSIISELREQNQDLSSKIAFYEKDKRKMINKKEEKKIDIVKDNKNDIEMIDDKLKSKEIAQNEKENIAKEEETLEEKIVEKNIENEENIDNIDNIENIEKFKISFEDILLFNLECKNVTLSNAKQLFSLVFDQFRDIDLDNDNSYKDSIIDSLTSSLSISLSLSQDKDSERLEIRKYLTDLFDSDDNSEFERNFYSIFENVEDHLSPAGEIIAKESEKKIGIILKKNKNFVENLKESFGSSINIKTLQDLMWENKIPLKRNDFFYLCYKLKGDEKSLYSVGTQGLMYFIK